MTKKQFAALLLMLDGIRLAIIAQTEATSGYKEDVYGTMISSRERSTDAMRTALQDRIDGKS